MPHARPLLTTGMSVLVGSGPATKSFTTTPGHVYQLLAGSALTTMTLFP